MIGAIAGGLATAGKIVGAGVGLTQLIEGDTAPATGSLTLRNLEKQIAKYQEEQTQSNSRSDTIYLMIGAGVFSLGILFILWLIR